MFYEILTVMCGLWIVVECKHIKGIQIENQGDEKLWVEMTDEEGFFLPSKQTASIVVEEYWSGRIRAQSADCKSIPCNYTSSFAVMKFQGEGNYDQYYISLIDGFNWPIKIQPTSSSHSCRPAACQTNVNHHCSATHQVKNDVGVVVACKSSPELFQKLCPQAIAREADIVSRAQACKSETYRVVIG
ncbi:hypothetical protein NQ317_015932 [Molorchus minor]|uniref:Uncharacterized protein n=1 Tax=Molorchus minor TaxID=1323400 RepID=A0ABQ9JJB7_9CUCU|nr:hypothetical protein NQ317_015932 [Molorchus minor]